MQDIENGLSPQIKCKRRQTTDKIDFEEFDAKSSVFDIEHIINSIEKKVAAGENTDAEEKLDIANVGNGDLNQSNRTAKKQPSREISEEVLPPKRKGFLSDLFYGSFFEKYDIKYLTSDEDKKTYDISKLRVVRYYLVVVEFSLLVNFIMNTLTSRKLLQIFINSPIDQIRFAMIMLVSILLVMSYTCNVKFTVWAFLPLQILQLINLNYHENILSFENVKDRNFEVLAGIMMF
jgi:hypothetical protein